MNHKSLVFIFAQHVIEKGVARAALLVQNAPLAHARVHQKTKRQGKIGLLREISNRLRMAVLLHNEIIFVQVVDEMPVLIANRRKHAYHLHVHRDGRPLLLLAP